jgi:Protein of unknown function (DUF1570)
MLALATWLGGCAGVLHAPPGLPARNAVALEQLTIHSDFSLPSQHRLLQDLRRERLQVYNTLQLPVSNEPIHVYLFDGEDRFRSFLRARFPNFPDRRAFFVKTDTHLVVYAHWGDRIGEDLRHEVAHGYLHAVLPKIPLWLDEGLAEYFEAPAGEGGLNKPHVDLLMARLARDGWRPSLERLEQLEATDDMGQADYAEAWAWVHYLLENGPTERQLLQQHLKELRETGDAPPLSTKLRTAEGDPAKAVADHLYRLAPSAQPTIP